jgi:1-acyl-sn-glycerol-3-phosphate acyltransferase
VSKAPDLPEDAIPWLHEVGRVIGRYLYVPAFKIRVHNMDRFALDGPVVLVANHSSMIEPQLLFGIAPRRAVFLVKGELFKGMAGRGLRAIGQLAIRRGEADRRPLLAAVRVLKGGGLIGVFPEGTRGDGDVLNAEQGAAWLVRQSGALVQPVAVRGTKRPAGSGRRFRPVVDVLVGKPLEATVGPGRSGLQAGTEQIRAALADLVAELDRMRDLR